VSPIGYGRTGAVLAPPADAAPPRLYGLRMTMRDRVRKDVRPRRLLPSSRQSNGHVVAGQPPRRRRGVTPPFGVDARFHDLIDNACARPPTTDLPPRRCLPLHAKSVHNSPHPHSKGIDYGEPVVAEPRFQRRQKLPVAESRCWRVSLRLVLLTGVNPLMLPARPTLTVIPWNRDRLWRSAAPPISPPQNRILQIQWPRITLTNVVPITHLNNLTVHLHQEDGSFRAVAR